MKLDIIDVFGSQVLRGNPLAVVHGGEALDTPAMQALTDWLGFSETTFLLPPTVAGADYRVRIFAGHELPFAGHPTLGTCHAWLAAGGVPARNGVVVQECGVGLVEIRWIEEMLAFRAPPTRRGGLLSDQDRAAAARLCSLPEEAIVEAVHADNGPGWILLRLRSMADLLAAEVQSPAPAGMEMGLIAPCTPGGAACAPDGGADFELRAFFVNGRGVLVEDPVTGSLNAAAAQYLFGAGLAKGRYVAAQGRKVGADGRVVCVQDDDGAVWVAGRTVTVAGGAEVVAWAK